ncbi:unnamed protein product [Lampetra planeri]
MASKDPAYEIIRTNKVKLQEYLQAKSSEVLDHSCQTGIVLRSEYASLKSENDPIARTRHLVDLVLDKGEVMCMRFLEAVLVPLRSEIPLLDQWISQHEQQLKMMGVDLSRTAGKAIPGAASRKTKKTSGGNIFVKIKNIFYKDNPGDDYRELLLKLTSLTRDYNARPGEPAVFLLERMVKPILVLYYRQQETKEHELLARGKQHEELIRRAQREGMTYKKLFDPIEKKKHPRLVIVVGIPGSGKTMLSKFIVHSLLSEEPVEILDLSHCGIGTEEMKRLQPGLHKCKELVLSYNEIGDSGLRLLADGMLGREGSLKTLDLCYCSLTYKSGSSLSVILKANTGLKSLKLRDNKIGDSGLRLLADGMLGREGSLETLDLRECSLRDKSGSSLSVILKANTRLKSLELTHNKIRDSGLRLLADGMLGREGSLEMLDLQDCSLTDKSIPALHDIMITNKALKEFRLRDNDLSEEGKQELRRKLTRGGDLYI